MISNVYTILVGMDSQLENCAADVEAISSVLSVKNLSASKCEIPMKFLSSETSVTVAALTTAVELLSGMASSEDAVFFYYSGHGTQHQELVLSDGVFSLASLKSLLSQAPCKLKILVLDACHLGNDPAEVKVAKIVVPPPGDRVVGTVTLASSTSEQQSWASADPKSPSYFTKAFVSAISQNSQIRWYEELLGLLRVELDGFGTGKKQDPVLTLNITGTIQLFSKNTEPVNSVTQINVPIGIWHGIGRNMVVQRTSCLPEEVVNFLMMFCFENHGWHLVAPQGRFRFGRKGVAEVVLPTEAAACSLAVGRTSINIRLSGKDLSVEMGSIDRRLTIRHL